MANNRLWLVCKECRAEGVEERACVLLLAKFWGVWQPWDSSQNEEDRTAWAFFKKHSHWPEHSFILEYEVPPVPPSE